MRRNRNFPLTASLISGILLILPFPPFEFEFAVWFALVPLLLAIRGQIPFNSFLLGYLCGIVWNIGLLGWIQVYHPLGLPIVVFALSFYPALFCLGLNLITNYKFQITNDKIKKLDLITNYKLRITNLQMILIAPFLWTSLEYVQSLGFLGFPWNSLGYSQYRQIPVIQIAEFTGVFGVSFLIVFVNSGIASAIIAIKENFRYAVKVVAVVCFVFGLCIFWGGYVLKTPFHVKEDSIRVALIQSNTGTDCAWRENSSGIIEQLTALSLTAGIMEPDLIIWPESAVGENMETTFIDSFPASVQPSKLGHYTYNDKVFNELSDFSWLKKKVCHVVKETGAYLLTGAPYNCNGRDYNSAFLISPIGKLLDRYDKIRLVPGGEYFPFWRHAKLFECLLQDAGDFTPGNRLTIFKISENKKFGVLICFEGIFGNLARRFVKNGADFLINITNDVWSHSAASHYQHASIATFRAIENRVYFIRVGNSGISRIINPHGRIEKNLGAYRSGFLVGEIYPVRKKILKKTLYTRHGDLFAKLVLVLTFIAVIACSCKACFALKAEQAR